MGEILLELENVRGGYGHADVLHGVNLRVYQGQIVALLGRNGAGKSTTLRAISGLLPSVSGVIRLGREEITHRKPHQIARMGLAHVREGHQIFPMMSVRDNLEMGAFSRGGDTTIEQDIESVLEMFPVLRRKLHHRGALLSGGEQQMLALAQGLMLRPKILVCDEPSLGLAPLVVKETFEKLQELKAAGVTILLVEQRVTNALEICDYGYILEDGEIRQEGVPDYLRSGTTMLDSYLGTAETQP